MPCAKPNFYCLQASDHDQLQQQLAAARALRCSQQADNISQQRCRMLQIVRLYPSTKQALQSNGGVLHSRSTGRLQALALQTACMNCSDLANGTNSLALSATSWRSYIPLTVSQFEPQACHANCVPCRFLLDSTRALITACFHKLTWRYVSCMAFFTRAPSVVFSNFAA